MRRNPRRRGSAYIAVLGAAMLVTVISMASIAAVRVRFRSGNLTSDTASADLLAQSMMQIAIDRISRDPKWRVTHTHNVWTSPEPLGDGMACYMFFDEADADLADDPFEQIRIHARADVGGAVRIYSARFNPPEMPNLITNPGFEEGATGWYGENCSVDVRTINPHSGLQYLRADNRLVSWAGPRQRIVSGISNKATYDVTVWAFVGSGTANVYAGVSYLASGSGAGSVTCTPVTVGQGWVKVRGYITPTWSGLLSPSPVLLVGTSAGTATVYIDDVSLIRVDNQVLTMAPGSWRREILP
jgi:hypothetical protein